MSNVKWYHQCASQLINADYNTLPVDDLESPVQLPLANVSGVKPTFGVHCKPRPLRVPAMQCKHRVDIEIFFLKWTKILHFVSTTDFLQHLTYICEWWRYLIMTIMQTESQRTPTFTFTFTFCVRVLECLKPVSALHTLGKHFPKHFLQHSTYICEDILCLIMTILHFQNWVPTKEHWPDEHI